MARRRSDSGGDTQPKARATRKPAHSSAPTLSERPTERPAPAVAPRASLDDDRPTELHELHEPQARMDVAHSRQQIIAGSTIREMINSRDHKLSAALRTLVDRAKEDLAGAVVDARASLLVRHDFEFDKRTGYVLKLRLFDPRGQCVQVDAELDQDGRAIRRGSMIAKLINI